MAGIGMFMSSSITSGSRDSLESPDTHVTYRPLRHACERIFNILNNNYDNNKNSYIPTLNTNSYRGGTM